MLAWVAWAHFPPWHMVWTSDVSRLAVTIYNMSPLTWYIGPWPCNCEGPWFSSNGHITNMVYWNLHQSYLLEVGLMQNFDMPWKIIYSLPCRNPCKLFIHENFFGPLGLHLLAWSELRWSLPFQPMRDRRMQWSWAFSLACEWRKEL